MPESEEQRSDRASKIAEAKGRRDAIVDSRLEGHDRRLASINGQIERGARATEILSDRISSLGTGVNDLRTDLKVKREVDEALREKAEQTLKQQITRREFWMGVFVIVVSVVSVASQIGHW